MPNHIKNIIELQGSLSDLNAIINEFGTFHPSELRKTEGNKELICHFPGEDFKFCWFDLKTGLATNRSGLNQIGLPDGYEPEIRQSFFQFPDFTKVIPPPDCPEYRDEPSQEVAKLSPNWWYSWNCENWGTKWESYSCERLAINKFSFETAWSSVPDIINTMSLKYPNINISYLWADEDTGANCGRSIYLNGLIDEYKPDNHSNEAYEIAFEARPEIKDYYILTEGGYDYKED